VLLPDLLEGIEPLLDLDEIFSVLQVAAECHVVAPEIVPSLVIIDILQPRVVTAPNHSPYKVIYVLDGTAAALPVLGSLAFGIECLGIPASSPLASGTGRMPACGRHLVVVPDGETLAAQTVGEPAVPLWDEDTGVGIHGDDSNPLLGNHIRTSYPDTLKGEPVRGKGTDLSMLSLMRY
jgi:hypothetical protein